MSSSRLTRPNQTYALAYINAFDDPTAPTLTELNDRRFVHFLSCALTEDGTNLTLGDSETDDTITFCSVGNESTPTFYNPTAQFTWLKDANTGGSGSTVDLTSLYNKATAMLDHVDIPYFVISRTGPTGDQDADFEAGHVIKMASFTTDYPVDVIEQNAPVRGSQTFVHDGQFVAWNITLS